MERYELPEGRAWTTLADILEAKYGKGLPERERRVGEVPVYGSSGAIGYHDTALTEGPTLIIGRKGSVGAVHFSISPCWPIDTTYYVDHFPHELSPHYLNTFLRSIDLAQLDRSTAVPGINRAELYTTDLPLPPLAEQHRIVAKIDQLMALCDELERKLTTARGASETLMAAAAREVLAA